MDLKICAAFQSRQQKCPQKSWELVSVIRLGVENTVIWDRKPEKKNIENDLNALKITFCVCF